jgi:hypothetical protein
MTINPYHGMESSRAAHPTGAEPYLSPNQPERAWATNRVVRIRDEEYAMRVRGEGRATELTEDRRKDGGDECNTGLVRVQSPNSVQVEDNCGLLGGVYQPPGKRCNDADRCTRGF